MSVAVKERFFFSRVPQTLAFEPIQGIAVPALENRSFLTKAQKVLFKKWSNEKRMISVVVRTKSSFFLHLEDFNKPEDVALVAFVSDETRSSITERSYSCFDLILFFESSQYDYRNLSHFDDVVIPGFEQFGKELEDIIDLSKLQLIYANEYAHAPVCKLRKKLGLNGPYLSDLAHICSKDLGKLIARKHNIPTAKSVAVNLSESTEGIAALVAQIEAEIGGYPMFKRPIALAGSAGAERIDSRSELFAWLRRVDEDEDKTGYVIEEFLTGREFFAVVCLLPDGSVEPLVVRYLEFGFSVAGHIETGRPVTNFVDSFYNAEEEFPRLREFVDKVIRVFNPPCPQIFCVQGFQRAANSDDYLLVELAHRPAGPRTNSMCYKACGISQETAMLMSHIDPSYRPKLNRFWKRPIELALWFPQRKGILEGYTDLPGKENVGSEITAEWLHPVGAVMEQAKDTSENVVILTLRCDDRKQLLRDAKWVAENWRPILG